MAPVDPSGRHTGAKSVGLAILLNPDAEENCPPGVGERIPFFVVLNSLILRRREVFLQIIMVFMTWLEKFMNGAGIGLLSAIRSVDLGINHPLTLISSGLHGEDP